MLNRRSLRATALSAVAALLLGACAQGGAGGGQTTGGANKTVAGGVIGALGGAVAGGVLADGDSTDRRQKAMIGAGIGALAGAAIGNYMDRQEQQLRQDLEATPVNVQRQGDTIVLSMPNEVSFPHDSAQLQPSGERALMDVAQVLRNNPKTTVDVIGYTDSTGAEDYNQRLSERRAQAVAMALVNQGVARERVIAYGRGETNPVASNQTPEGRAQNRRVEIRINPLRDAQV